MKWILILVLLYMGGDAIDRRKALEAFVWGIFSGAVLVACILN